MSQGSKLNPYVREEKKQAERNLAVYIRIGDFLEELVTLKAEEIKLKQEELEILKAQFSS